MPHALGYKVDTPFARYLNKRGLNSSNLGEFTGVANRLARDPKAVAPNSPMLPSFAQFLDISLRQLKSFAEGPEMSKKFVRKIEGQMAAGTIPRGTSKKKTKQRPPMPEPQSDLDDSDGEVLGTVEVGSGNHRREPLSNSTAFAKLVFSKGTSLTDLAERLHIPTSMMWRVSGGGVAPNHPVLEMIATALDVPISELSALQKGKVLEGGYLKAAGGIVAGYKKKKGKARQAGTAVVKHENEKMTAPVQYNRLGSKRTELQLRAAARLVVSTLNTTVMRGETHIILPTEDVFLILHDYLREKGVRASILVDPEFAQLFDPK